jgi:hypothetical protein
MNTTRATIHLPKHSTDGNLKAAHRKAAAISGARLTPLTMVEAGLLPFSNCLFRAIRRIPPAYCRRSACIPSHPIKENLPGWSFCALQPFRLESDQLLRPRARVILVGIAGQLSAEDGVRL